MDNTLLSIINYPLSIISLFSLKYETNFRFWALIQSITHFRIKI